MCITECGLSSCLLFLSPHPLFTLAHLPFITVIINIVIVINIIIVIVLVLLIIITPMMTFAISVLLCLQTLSTIAHRLKDHNHHHHEHHHHERYHHHEHHHNLSTLRVIIIIINSQHYFYVPWPGIQALDIIQWIIL